MSEAALRGVARRAPLSADQVLMRAGMWLAVAFLAVFLVLPVGMLLLRAFETPQGGFAGLANFRAYAGTPALVTAAWNSLWTAALTAAIVVPLAFLYAYALTRSCIPAKPAFRAVMMLPLLAPSLLPALAVIYLFGHQGMLRGALLGHSIHGPVGIVVAQVFHCFPSAALILAVALSTADARLYEAAAALRASRARMFRTITLPGARYGLVSAFVVVFTLVMTDFGIPKVIGGQFPVLATEVYRQMVGLQNVNMGAVAGIVLLAPTMLAYLLDRWAARQRAATLSGRTVPLRPTPRRQRDVPLLVLCLVVAVVLIGIVAVAVWGSLIRSWPYDLSLTLDNYDFARFDALGWGTVWLSVRMAVLVVVIGTVIVFIVAYVLERGGQDGVLSKLARFATLVPLAVPGLVLGLAYALFFNHPANPLEFMPGTIAILVVNSLVHFYTVGHLMAVTAIRQLDPEFEAVSASMRVPVWVTFGRVIVPICLPAILEIAAYLFVSAMTTVSAVIFLYGPDARPAAIAVLQMDENGEASAAAAMTVVILGITTGAKVAQLAAGEVVARLTQGWRR